MKGIPHINSKSQPRYTLFSRLTFSFIGQNLLPFLVRGNEDVFQFHWYRIISYIIKLFPTLYSSLIFTTENLYFQDGGIFGTRSFIKTLTIWELILPIHILEIHLDICEIDYVDNHLIERSFTLKNKHISNYI